MNKLLAWISIFTLAALACGITANTTTAAVAAPTPPAEVWMIVADNAAIRDEPNGNVIGGLKAGERVKITQVNYDKLSDYAWCRHEQGWTACELLTPEH